MTKIFESTQINGSITAPPSKSYMQRLLCAALLCEGETEILNIDYSKDSQNALKLIQEIGAKTQIIENKNIIKIKGGFNIQNTNLNIGESGLGIRMFTPVLSLSDKQITIDGDGSLKNRTMKMLIEPLIEAGVICNSNNGFIPIQIKGKLKGGNINIDGSISSQVLTGFLMALPLANQDSTIFVKNLNSKPYIDLTIEIISKFGIEIENQNYEIFKIKGNQKYFAKNIDCENDWSSAAFLMVAGAVGGKIEIFGLNLNSKQADKKILDILQKNGANIYTEKNKIIICKNKLNAFNFDATDSPDLFPILAILAANCNGTSKIIGTNRLIHKESNRAEVIKNEFSKLGINIILSNNEMYITGNKIIGAEINSHNDHRIAMAATIASINCCGKIIISNADCINKSYPNFFEDFDNIKIY